MTQTLADRLEEGISQIVAFVPHLALALGILIAGFAIAKMVERGTATGLRRIGFDRWMQEGGVTEALARAGTELDPSGVLAKLVFWTVMLLVILLASDALGLVVVSALFTELLAYIPSVIAAIVILILGILLGEFVKNLVLASAGGMGGVPTLARAGKAAVILLAIFMALGQLGIAEQIVLVAFIAVAGAAALAAGIAFGLGARDLAGELAREWYERSRIQRPREPRTDESDRPAAGARGAGEPGAPDAPSSSAPAPRPTRSDPPAAELDEPRTRQASDRPDRGANETAEPAPGQPGAAASPPTEPPPRPAPPPRAKPEAGNEGRGQDR